MEFKTKAMITTIQEAAEMQEQLPYLFNVDQTLPGEENDAEGTEDDEELVDDEDEDVIE